jgi:hypothetical protein
MALLSVIRRGYYGARCSFSRFLGAPGCVATPSGGICGRALVSAGSRDHQGQAIWTRMPTGWLVTEQRKDQRTAKQPLVTFPLSVICPRSMDAKTAVDRVGAGAVLKARLRHDAEGQVVCVHQQIMPRSHRRAGRVIFDGRHSLAVVQRNPVCPLMSSTRHEARCPLPTDIKRDRDRT